MISERFALVLQRLLGHPVQPVPERWLSGFASMLGLRGTTDDLVHHTIAFASDYDAEFDDVFVARRLVCDPTVYVSASCATDASAAPADSENWFVLVNTPAGGSESSADGYEQQLVDRLGLAPIHRSSLAVLLWPV
jgi:phytoene dehydrogenase-like protein